MVAGPGPDLPNREADMIRDWPVWAKLCSTCLVVALALSFARPSSDLTRGLDRRQFMAECVTARGTSDLIVRGCAQDFPRFEAMKAHGWRVTP